LKKYPEVSCGAGILRPFDRLRASQAQYKSCPLITKDRQDAHPTKLGNLFFGDPLSLRIQFWDYTNKVRLRGLYHHQDLA
ncbi:hypothetical protein OA07_16015, partial [Aphanizomenon flos-aquae 2012/KM1/D3]|uniref:hypothetical protein n=1 Tax=Aphanizomenon flos-aquae TaxID=1176 RepID=UPI000542E722